MSQVVDQQNQTGGNEPAGDSRFMIPVEGIDSEPQKGSVSDYNAIGDTDFGFQDYGLKLTNGFFSINKTYYLHAKIKRMDSVQNYIIELISSDPEQEATQYIQPVKITKAVAQTGQTVIKEFVDVEFLFTPVSNFDIIVFQLKRTQEDDLIVGEGGVITGRDPAIAFIELCEMNNKKPSSKPLKKIGLQSHPDFVFCINNEEFHLPQSGIFELRDGIVDINFFSVVEGAILQNEESDLAPQMNENTTINVIDRPKKVRQIDAFTLDYMYSTTTEG